jgi:uncharacterized protein YjbI with pentapeptide repeats
MTADADDRSTWPRNGQVIRRAELLRLIEEHGGPDGLDLRGAILVGDGSSDNPRENPIDLSPEALAPLADAYRQAGGSSNPPWLYYRGGVSVSPATLERASFVGARLQRAGMIHAHLSRADLSGADLRDADLVQADLSSADLGSAELDGAKLYEAHLQQAGLVGAHLRGSEVWGARLQGAHLQGAELQGLDMYGVSTLDGAYWAGALLDHTRIRRESLGSRIGEETSAHAISVAGLWDKRTKAFDYHDAKEAYLLLKNNFNQIGRYEDASWAYVKEQQMEKMAYHWEWRSHKVGVQRAWGSFWRWLRNWAYELLTGYGERPWNPVVGGVVIVLGFAGGFCATRAIANFWDAVVYSVATLGTFNLARLEPQGRGMEVASSVEAILGISVLALVVFTLGNKMSRG